MSGRAVAEHPLLHRLCQPHLQGSVGPAGGISIHLDFTLPNADAFGKAANKAERFLLASQAAKLRQALSSFSGCQAWPGLGLLSESPAPWWLHGEVSPLTHCWQGINSKRQDSTMQWGKRKVPCGGSSALCKGARASPWPPGLHVQPLWALLLLPVWWEMPDPLGNWPKAMLARVTRSQGWARRAAVFPAAVQSVGREAAGETCRHHSVLDALFPHPKGHWWSSQRWGGKEGASLSPALRPAGQPGRQTCC